MRNTGTAHIIKNENYVVRFAQNEGDVRTAQRLRYEVFNVELAEGLESSRDQKRDADIFDAQCDHLLVADRESGEVIGTCRLQTNDIAAENQGFYTAREFDMTVVPRLVTEASVEVGRACIRKDHRNGRVLYLLWRGLAEYMAYYGKRYLFGCCSLTSQSPETAWAVMEYLSGRHCFHKQLLISPKQDYGCEKVKPAPQTTEAIKLPQLFRLYMDLGAKVCSYPALDRAFRTIDYLVLLDIEQLDERTKMLFFK